MKEDGQHMVISTKVSTYSFERFTQLLKKCKSTVYDRLQGYVSFDVHCNDTPHGLTEREEVLKNEMDEILEKSLRISNSEHINRLGCSEATYYFSDKDGKETGVIGCQVQDPFFDSASISWNHRQIIERAFCLLYPQTYKRLRLLGSALECRNIIETILTLMTEHEDASVKVDIDTLMSDNDVDEFGKKAIPGDCVKYKRKMYKSVDSKDLFDGA